jgi:hypothetical protein
MKSQTCTVGDQLYCQEVHTLTIVHDSMLQEQSKAAPESASGACVLLQVPLKDKQHYSPFMSSGIHIGILFIGCPTFFPHCSIFSIMLAKKERVPDIHTCMHA